MPDYRLPVSRRRDQHRVLSRLLEVREMNQDGLAALLDVDKSRVSRWMHGWVICDAYWLIRIGVVLALSDAEVRTLATAAASLAYEWGASVRTGRPLVPPLARGRVATSRWSRSG